jgi:hypothetical protein
MTRETNVNLRIELVDALRKKFLQEKLCNFVADSLLPLIENKLDLARKGVTADLQAQHEKEIQEARVEMVERCAKAVCPLCNPDWPGDGSARVYSNELACLKTDEFPYKSGDWCHRILSSIPSWKPGQENPRWSEPYLGLSRCRADRIRALNSDPGFLDRIRNKARLEEAKWWLEYYEANVGYRSLPADLGPKRLGELEEALRWEVKT